MGVHHIVILLGALIVLRNVTICKCQSDSEIVAIGPVKFCCLERGECGDIDESSREIVNLPYQVVEFNASVSSWSEVNQLNVTLSVEGSLNCYLEDDDPDSNLFAVSLLPQKEPSDLGKKISGKFTIDGYFDTKVKGYAPDGYCIHSLSANEILVKICKPPEPDPCNGVKKCIRKCCKSNEVYDLANYGGSERIQCVQTSHPWIPTFYKASGERLQNDQINSTSMNGFVSSHPSGDWCEETPVLYSQRKIHNEREYRIRILEDGTVMVRHHYRSWETLAPEAFCIDGAQNFPGYGNSKYEGNERDVIIIDCSAPKLIQETAAPLIYGIFQGIASLFLLLTVLVYAILWEKQNIHSWTLLGYAISTLCLYTSQVLTYFHVHFTFETSEGISVFCSVIGVCTHFCFISTFCWMTLINFDVWWTFQNLKIKVGNAKNKGRFLLYTLFGLGVPTLVVSIGLLLDYFYMFDIDSQIIRPEYGESGSKCFMNFEFAVIPYLYIPIGVLLGCNLLFFIVTVYTLHKISESTKFATNMSSNQSQSAKAKLLLFFKLFIVTGVTWTFDLASVLLSGVPSVQFIVYIFDILNIMQAVAIFIIFVCKVEVLRGLQQKYPSLRLNTSNGTLVRERLELERFFNAITRKKSPSGRSVSSVVTDDTNISTSSIRSIGSHHQHQITLKTMGAGAKNLRKS